MMYAAGDTVPPTDMWHLCGQTMVYIRATLVVGSASALAR